MSQPNRDDSARLASSGAVEYLTASPEATRRLGQAVGELVRPGDVLLLSGPYGAGKTTFTQGLAQGMGVDDYVHSPSFTLVNEYHPAVRGAHPPLFHLDLYRISGALEALDFGLDEYLDDSGVCAIEWPATAEEAMPEERLELRFAIPDPTSDERRITVEPHGARYRELLRQLGDRLPDERLE